MDGHLYGDNSCPGAPQHFTDQIAQLFGEAADLDPLFLEESWTLGVPAATDRWQQRQRAHTDRERQSQSFRDLHNLASIHFVEATDPAGFVPDVLAASVATGYRAASSLSAPRETATSLHHPSSQAGAAFLEPTGATYPTTRHDALRLLGVATGGTPGQLRSAYRRMVSQYHPDRVARTTDTQRQRATDHMAAINEAYRILRANLPPESD
jgi:DnaJ-domain-containing protein 1